MLHLLVSQTNASPSSTGAGSSEVEIRRHGEWVKISVELGPDASPTAELERRWLSRMAVRHGGRLELEGGVETMWLPADGASDQREVAELRRELEQAQQLGEAYARELAQVFSAAASPPIPSSIVPGDASTRLDVVVAAMNAITREMGSFLDAVRGILDEPSDARERLANVRQRVTLGQEQVAELERVADCPLDEESATLDAAAILRDCVAALESRARRRHIRLKCDAPKRLETIARPAVLALMIRGLLDHALSATPRDGEVRIELTDGAPVTLWVEDGGPVVPVAARAALLARRVDPTSLGRPDGISLLVADIAAGVLGSELSIHDVEGRTRFRVRL
jgi:signal transduction histidine kinase